MKKGIKRVLSIAMVGTTLAFAVMGTGCNNTVTDWFEEQYNQLTCEHKNESKLEAVAPTCTEDGLTEGVECADCGKILVKQDKVNALGHDTIKHEKVEATCMTSGLTAGEYCLVCNTWVKEQKKINATGHKVVELKAVAATCTETGLTTGQACEYCDEVYQAQQVIAALGHSYNDNHVCTTCGECDHNFVDYECEYCGLKDLGAIVNYGSYTMVNHDSQALALGDIYRIPLTYFSKGEAVDGNIGEVTYDGGSVAFVAIDTDIDAEIVSVNVDNVDLTHESSHVEEGLGYNYAFAVVEEDGEYKIDYAAWTYVRNGQGEHMCQSIVVSVYNTLAGKPDGGDRPYSVDLSEFFEFYISKDGSFVYVKVIKLPVDFEYCWEEGNFSAANSLNMPFTNLLVNGTFTNFSFDRCDKLVLTA